MLRAYKYRIYPTEEQKVMLAKTFGCCRYVYNWALDLREKTYKEGGKTISKYDMLKLIVGLKNESSPWLKEVSAKAIEFAIFDLYRGYDYFFAGNCNKPKHRRKYGRQSYHDSGNAHGNGVHAYFKRGLLDIPKIKGIPCVFHRRFKGRIKQVCIELLPSGKYHAKILVDDKTELPTKEPIDPKKALGIDTGLEHFAVLSDGQTYEPTHEGKKEFRRMKLMNRRICKKQKGSRQFRILKHRLALLHERIANRRHDHIHKITHYLAYENQATTICVEDLNVVGMKRNKYLAYNMEDACLGEFYRQLEYKCAWNGKNFIKIDRWAPSSKMCSHCGHIYKTLTVKMRHWTCPVCGTHHDRDLNAANNIKAIGLGQKTLPSVRRDVKPVEKATVDDRSLEPKKQPLVEAGKVKVIVHPMP